MFFRFLCKYHVNAIHLFTVLSFQIHFELQSIDLIRVNWKSTHSSLQWLCGISHIWLAFWFLMYHWPILSFHAPLAFPLQNGSLRWRPSSHDRFWLQSSFSRLHHKSSSSLWRPWSKWQQRIQRPQPAMAPSTKFLRTRTWRWLHRCKRNKIV